MKDKISHQMEREIRKLERDIEPRLRRLSSLKDALQALNASPALKKNASPVNAKGLGTKKSRKKTAFVDMTKPQAAVTILMRHQKPMNTREMMLEMMKGGMEITGKNERDQKSNVYTGLTSSSIVEKLPGGYWVLPDWDKAKKKIKN